MKREPSGKQFLWGLFVFLYTPVAYFWGWGLFSTLGIDFPSYYYGARFAFVERRSPYGFGAFTGLLAHVGQHVNPYLYPPPSLLAFWPLTHFSLPQARTVFLVVSHIFYIGSIWLLLARLTPLNGERRPRETTVGISLIYLVCFDPAHATLGLGQVNFFALFSLCVALAALKRSSSPWAIGLPLSIAILLKTYPVLLFVPLLFRKRFRAVAVTCVFLGAFSLIAALVLPSEVWSDWWSEVVPAAGYANPLINPQYAWNQSLNGFVTRLLLPSSFSQAPLPHPSRANPAATVMALLTVGATTFFSFRLARNEGFEGSGDDEISAYLLMIFIVAPLSWDHHLVYILPAAVFAISLVVNGLTSGIGALTATASLCVMSWPIPLENPSITHGWWTLLISIKFYAVVVLWLFFINRLWQATSTRRGRHPSVVPDGLIVR